MWVYIHLEDVCSDMSAFHGVRDISRMGGAAFFKAAERLYHYGGAVKFVLDQSRALLEEVRQEIEEEERGPRYLDPLTGEGLALEKKEEPSGEHVMTFEEIQAASTSAPQIGQTAGLFEVVKCT